MTRWRASSLHLGLSALVGLGFAALTRIIWYPGPFFEPSGALGLLTILVPVDVLIGPLLTLVVFKSGKPSLRFDLTVIALLQVSALMYGAWVIAEARPAYVVFFANQLSVIRSTDLAQNAPWTTPLRGPQWVGIPSDSALSADVGDLLAALNGKKTPLLDRQRYQPWLTTQAAFREALQPIEELTPASAIEAVKSGLKAQSIDPTTVQALPIIIRDHKMTAFFAADSDEIVAIVPVETTAR